MVIPEFPTEEPGQRVKFWVHVVGWAAKSAWVTFRKLPRWMRLIISLWLCAALLTKGCSDKATTTHVTPESAEKLKAIAVVEVPGSAKVADIGKLGADIAREILEGRWRQFRRFKADPRHSVQRAGRRHT